MAFDPDAPAAPGALFGLPCTAADARVVLLPVPWEATTSYRRGTKGGPAATLAASAQVDLFDLEVGDAWKAGFFMLDPDPRVEAWNDAAEPDALAVIESGGDLPEAAARVDRFSERVNEHVYGVVNDLFRQGRIPGVVGGDHSVPFGAIQAAAAHHPGLGVLHVDAHADLRRAYEGFTWSHASIFYNVLTRLTNVSRVVQVGLRDVGEQEVRFAQDQRERVVWFTDLDLARNAAAGEPWMRQASRIVDALPERVWISFDVDGMDPALCPGTGTPVPGGLAWREVQLLLGEVGRRRHIVGFDLNEIGPGEWDGNVAARLLYKLCGWAVRGRTSAT